MQKEYDWLVRPPAKQKFNEALVAACHGNSNCATLMNYFLYEATMEVDRTKIDKTTTDSIVIKRPLDDIIAGLKRLGKTACKKTVEKWIVKLQSYGFLKKDGYHQIYKVLFKAVEEAFTNVPEPEQPKPRGRHAHKQQEVVKDCNFKGGDSKFKNVKTTILDKNDAREIVILREEIVNLQSEMVKLQSQIVNLQSEMVKLQSSESCRSAWEAAVEGQISELFKLYNINYNINLDNIKYINTSEGNEVPQEPSTESAANADATHTSSSLPSLDPPIENEEPPQEKKGNQAPPTQPALLEVSGPPVMPPAEAKWTAEVVVQLTEAKIGKRFEEVVRVVNGKRYKTQRERQIEAAKKVVTGFTREEYTTGYDHRNDAWWKESQGTLTVVHMVSNTGKGVMRLIEELENIKNDAARIKPATPNNKSTSSTMVTSHGQRPEDYQMTPTLKKQKEEEFELLRAQFGKKTTVEVI